MEAAAASTMDFHALSRRELQALCKCNGVRANMTNAAMADALQNLTSVDRIDEIGTTLCLPTPGRSAMKSAAKAASVAGEEQQHGSPLPRGRRVSVMSPAAIRMNVEEGDDELKRDLVKEIVKTPGVALRSTSRRARATPAPLPTPATLRRSQRTAARKATAPVEAENRVEEASTVKRTTRTASARSKMMVDLDLEEEVAAVTPKVQQEEPKVVASDVNCDDPEEEEAEVTKLLDGDNKEEEPEQGEEVDSSDAANRSVLRSDTSCDDRKVEEVVTVEQEATKPQKGEMRSQVPAATEEDDTGKEGLNKELKESADEMQQAELTEEEASDELTEEEEWSSDDDEASEEIDSTDDSEGDCTEVKSDFDNVKELVQVMQETSIASKASKDSAEEASEEDGSADEEASEEDGSADEEASEEDGSADEEASEDGSSDVEASEDGSVDVEASEYGLADEEVSEEDDFTSDLPLEFDNIVVLSDAETESETTSAVKENQAAVASATKTSVKSTGDSAISVTNKEEVSEEKDVIDGAMMEVSNTVDNIVKSLDQCTIKEGTQQAEEENLNTMVETVGRNGKQMEDYSTMSMRKLKSTLKNQLSTKEGKKNAEVKRLPLEEVDDTACANC